MAFTWNNFDLTFLKEILKATDNFEDKELYLLSQYLKFVNTSLRYIFDIYLNTFAGINSLLINHLPCLSIHLPYQFSLDPCPYIPSFCFMDKGTG